MQRLRDGGLTLQAIANRYGISRERVRQLTIVNGDQRNKHLRLAEGTIKFPHKCRGCQKTYLDTTKFKRLCPKCRRDRMEALVCKRCGRGKSPSGVQCYRCTTADNIVRATALRQGGLSYQKIAALMGVSAMYAWRLCRDDKHVYRGKFCNS